MGGEPVERWNVGAEYFYDDIAADADDHLLDTHVDRLSETIRDPRQLIEHLAQFPEQPILIIRAAPFLRRLCKKIRIRLIQAHRIEAQFIGSGPSDDTRYLGHRLHDGFVNLQVERRTIFKTDRWKLLDTDNHRTLVHGRHEGFPDLAIGGYSNSKNDNGGSEHEPLVSQCPPQNGNV